MNMNIKDIIKDNTVRFDFLRAGVAYYKVSVDGVDYRFPVRLDDVGDATLLSEDKAIMLMRWIRKAISDNEFHKI